MKNSDLSNTVRISVKEGKSVKIVHLADRISMEVDAQDEVIAIVIKDVSLHPANMDI